VHLNATPSGSGLADPEPCLVLLSPALAAAGAGLALDTPAVARVAAIPGGALALSDDAVRVRRPVLAAAGLEAAGQEGALFACVSMLVVLESDKFGRKRRERERTSVLTVAWPL